MGRDRRRAWSTRSISITQRRDVVIVLVAVVVVPSTVRRVYIVISEGVAYVCLEISNVVCVCVCMFKGTTDKHKNNDVLSILVFSRF